MINDKGEEVGIIYGWYNTKSEKWYVGQTIRPLERFKDHIYAAINKKDNTKFYNALRKYGLDKFVYCVLEENVLRVNLNLKEIEWIEEFDSFYGGYNMTAGGRQTILSKESRKRMSESRKGKSSGMKGKTAWNKGKIGIYSEETKKKMSEFHKGIKNYNYNKPRTEETKKKISNALKGRPSPFKGKPSPNRKQVLKYDLNGNYIQTYISILEAKNQNPKCEAISAVCRGKRKQSGGFIWKYAS